LPFGERLMTRAAGSPQLVQLDSAFMLYLVLDELVAYFEELVEEINAEIEVMEERALQDLSEDFLVDLLRFKRYLFALNALADQHRNVFAAFLRPDFTFVEGNGVEIYFRDLDNRLHRLLGMLLSAQESVNGAFDIYVSHVSFRTNRIIKVLTVVSTTVLPVTVIVAFFGTSFRGMEGLYSPTGFLVMIAVALLVIATTLGAFRWKGWI
jgi:magnesium transporter